MGRICGSQGQTGYGLNHFAGFGDRGLTRLYFLAKLKFAFAGFEPLSRPARWRTGRAGQGIGRKGSAHHKLDVLYEGFLVGDQVNKRVGHGVELHGIAAQRGAGVAGYVLPQRGVGN